MSRVANGQEVFHLMVETGSFNGKKSGGNIGVLGLQGSFASRRVF